jgi:ABC-type nickel/cobalt efflux system permease component RcnA
MQFEGPAGLIGWAAQWADVLGAIGAVLVFLVALYVAIRETWRARKDRLREKHDAAPAEETVRDQAG